MTLAKAFGILLVAYTGLVAVAALAQVLVDGTR